MTAKRRVSSIRRESLRDDNFEAEMRACKSNYQQVHNHTECTVSSPIKRLTKNKQQQKLQVMNVHNAEVAASYTPIKRLN